MRLPPPKSKQHHSSEDSSQTVGDEAFEDAAELKRMDLENFCFGSGDSFQLGPCSSSFLKCGNTQKPFTFAECPLGSVFEGKECKEARKVRDCFVPEVNLLNDATEKLAQAVHFCAQRSPFDATLYSFDGSNPSQNCSRQALICRGTASAPLAIGCAPGKSLDTKTLSCVDAAEARRPSAAPECRRFRDDSFGGAECLDGQTKPSIDCKQFFVCTGGKWMARHCHDYATNRLKSAGGRIGNGNLKQPQADIYPLEHLLPDNFNPFEGQGVRHRRCVEGEKIVNRHDCARFMECVDGDWFSLSCPLGHYFSPHIQGCLLAVSNSSAAAKPMCQELLTVAEKATSITSELRDANFQSNSVYILPVLYPKAGQAPIGPGAGPLPELKDRELRQNYAGAFSFCDQNSASKLVNPYDCTRYRECALDSGGYYTEKQCAPGTQFDPALLQCTYDYSCVPSKCVEGIQEPQQKCGHARQCKGGEWHVFVCERGMAFVGGRCSDRVHCQSKNPLIIGQCVEGYTRSHATDCSKYLMCRYGQFLEENCNNGHRFNPTIGRCDPTYACPADRKPPCFEGEMRATVTAPTTAASCAPDFEMCRDGRFERISCPYGEHFAGGHCVAGGCAVAQSGGQGQVETTEETCTESPGPQGFRSNGQNCAKFYQCANGKWVPKDCAKGTVFNPALAVCDWPANVPGC
uniref:Chitin-binding type-2 domain-containing protein n=1 Tax=Globodera pallida TaxID=36090 RepID=A0A183C0Q6_GLOPA